MAFAINPIPHDIFIKVITAKCDLLPKKSAELMNGQMGQDTVWQEINSSTLVQEFIAKTKLLPDLFFTINL